MIKYLGRLAEICQMCGKYSAFIYLDDKSSVRHMFPELEWEGQKICEPCAKREAGKKFWNQIKRK